MTDRREIAPDEDPVCGMTVDPVQARANGLAIVFEETEFVFCGRGCMLEFRDAPETFLAADYTATM